MILLNERIFDCGRRCVLWRECKMLEGYLLGLGDEHIEFISEDHENFMIVPSSKKYNSIYEEKDIVEGILYTNRNIKLFGCIYNGRYISCQGYVYSYSNTYPDKLESFDRITFSGKAIDFFGGASGRVMEKLEDGVGWDERAYALVPKKWENICTSNCTVVDGIRCNVGITYHIKYNCGWGEREIGTCEPRFFVEFEDSVTIDMIPRIYLWVYDFLSFMNFRRNIEFDKIAIYKHVQMSEKYIKTGNVHIKTEGKVEYTNTENNSIIWSDIGDDISSLFGYIAERRNKNTSDELFIPSNDKEYKYIGHTTFLQCALTFEGEYDRTQATKSETNLQFKQVKEVAQNASVSAVCELLDNNDEQLELQEKLLEEIRNKFCQRIEELKEEQTSNAKQKAIEKYAKKILRGIEHIDFTLEEQFNNLIKTKYKDIISSYQIRLARRMGIELVDNYNLGAIFAEMRNNIGHGHPPKLEDIHAYTCQLARCMVYIMILEKNNMSYDKIKKIVQKIFI